MKKNKSMVKNNPYIEKVKEDTDIFNEPEKIYTHKGKWSQYFHEDNPLILEIGTGMGNFFSKQVGDYPDKNFIGMEIRYKRCFQTVEKSRRFTDKKSFVILKDFGENIDKIFDNEEVSETYIFFPDPWANKERQKKHRLMQAPFLENLYNITKKSGRVIFKSDHREYFDSTLEIIQKQGLWEIKKVKHNYANDEIFDMDNITEFEAFYRGENVDINYFELVK